MSLVVGPIIAVAISVVVVLALSRLASASVANRYAASIAFGVAFCVGFALLPSWPGLLPQRHWHWLPYLTLGATFLGPVALAQGIVPSWPSLQPPRTAYVPFLAGYFFLLIALLDPLPARLPGRAFIPLLAASVLCAGMMTAVEVSLTYGCVAAIAAAALIGCSAVIFVPNHHCSPATIARSLVPAFVIAGGGATFVGFVEPQPPLIPLLALPAAPLALWACTGQRVHHLHGVAATILQVAAVLLPLLMTMGWMVFGAVG
jgi:hypothetical protein